MNTKRWIAAIVAVGVVAVGVFGVWYFVFRDDSPPAVSIDRASGALGATSDTATAGEGAEVDGTWTVDTNLGSFSDFTSSFAGFRVQEELVGVGAKTAVGRTPDVTGSLAISGTTITDASVEVDMTTLTTDDGRRDNAIRQQAIETARFPTASFELTTPIELGSIPADGEEITVDAVGDLTLHGVTKAVTIPLTAKLQGDVIVVVGSLDIPFGDYSIDRPSAAAVLSVEDRGEMEVQLFFTKA
jgi:polyisoprenoid-binding protein YceI